MHNNTLKAIAEPLRGPLVGKGYDPELLYVECGRCGSPVMWEQGKATHILGVAGIDPLELDASCLLVTDACPSCGGTGHYTVQIFRVSGDAQTRRPPDATYMHYECELAVVIGKTGFQVSKDDAMALVAGYTVANDYAIRDYLENYYRPNLRVKNRDGCTPIGPWLVDRDDVPNPMALKLTTRVNDVVTQQGTTADMIFDIATLIEYLSSFMTLNPGDIILTGTPEGLADVKAGDVVETEIESVCSLENTIVDDRRFFAHSETKAARTA